MTMPIKLAKKGKTPLDSTGNPTIQCAAYVNATLRRNGINSWGDAPRINGQFKEIFNGYDDSGFSRRTADLGTTHNDSLKNIRVIHDRASNAVRKNFDSKTLDKNHYYTVNMYYRNSPHTTGFYNYGTDTPGTHIGVLYYNGNRWRVNHNIHGQIHDDDFISLQGGGKPYGVTAIADASYKPLTYYLNPLNVFRKIKNKLQDK